MLRELLDNIYLALFIPVVIIDMIVHPEFYDNFYDD
jgi:hypothetical protein